MVALKVSNVSKRFGSVRAVDRVSLEVDKAQIVSLLGPSGCGKTTTLRLIAGFEQPDEGSIFISGSNTQGRRPYELNVGLLFQDYALFPHMTVQQNVSFGMRHRGLPRDQIPSRTGKLLEYMKLNGLEARYPAQLSGGQRQRTALARALATEPDLLLLDEPLSALDAKLREELRVELKEILSDVGSATIIVTHDQEEAMGLSDSILVMNDGRVVQKGSAFDIYNRPSSRFVASFIGHSNWFTGRLGETPYPGIRLLHADGGCNLLIAASATALGSSCEVCVRPERIALQSATAKHEQSTQAPMNRLQGTVRDVTDLGSNVRYQVTALSGQRITIIEKSRRGERPAKGEPVGMVFSPEDCILVPRDLDGGNPV